MNRIRYQDYIYDLSSSGLEIEASDNQIQGEIEGGGRLFLEFGAGRNTFDGSTRLNGRWCGAKPGVEFPDGCSFAGKWKVWINGKTCDMEMNRIGNRVSGSLCTGENRRVFKSSEDISFNGNVSRLIAEFETNPEFKNFTITITGYDGNQFKGSIASVGLEPLAAVVRMARESTQTAGLRTLTASRNGSRCRIGTSSRSNGACLNPWFWTWADG